MHSLATEFPVDPATGPDDFLQAIVHWLDTDQQTSLPADALHALPRKVTGNLQALAAGEPKRALPPLTSPDATESLQVLATITPHSDPARPHETLAGISYSQRQGPILWTTTAVWSSQQAVGGKGQPSAWVGLRIRSSADDPMQRLPVDRHPAIVRCLLDHLGGGQDGPFTTSASPRTLSNGHDLMLAASAVLGSTGNRMPVVYVSANFQHGHAVNPARLANELAGLAHVLVEPGNNFSRQLQRQTDGVNVYGGTVGIHWPEGGEKRAFFLGSLYRTAAELHDVIREDIRRTHINRRPLPRCTWTHLRESSSRNAIAVLRSSGSGSVEDYIRNFDEELAAREQQLQDAENEIRRLEQELRRHSAHPGGMTPLLRSGEERDFYDNETLCILLDALQEASQRGVPGDSRRQHVLLSILKANPRPPGCLASQFRDTLKNLLRGTTTLDTRTRRDLEKMGFTITDGGKHYKLVYQGDDRYTYTLPSSGSDYRGGLNAASDIGRLMF